MLRSTVSALSGRGVVWGDGGIVWEAKKAIRVGEFGGMTEADLKVGAVLAYRGDHIPYVQSEYLIRKGREKGSYLLPAFSGIDEKTGKEIWTDIPGSKTDEYRIVEIERNRRGKRGDALPDMIWITGSGYKNVRFGLNPLDVCAKFSLVMSPEEAAEISMTAEERMAQKEALRSWEESVRSDGW